MTDRLQAVEKRYNGVRTLKASFTQTYRFQGRVRPVESGELYLSRPGRMRWEYRTPSGKLFVTDGKDVYFYSPASNRVEKSKFRDSGDFRVPLAFLLGKLDFRRDFRQFRWRPEGTNLRIVALPKSDRSPYREVEFLLTPDNVIAEVKITGQDGSLMEFGFRGETLNAPLPDSLFRFHVPPGAELVEVSEGEFGGEDE